MNLLTLLMIGLVGHGRLDIGWNGSEARSRVTRHLALPRAAGPGWRALVWLSCSSGYLAWM
jgi:hypothetical protein